MLHDMKRSGRAACSGLARSRGSVEPARFVNQAAAACPGPRTALLVGGEYVVVTVLARAIAKTGRTMENEQCFLFKVRDDRVVHGRVYADTAKARELISPSPARR